MGLALAAPNRRAEPGDAIGDGNGLIPKTSPILQQSMAVPEVRIVLS